MKIVLSGASGANHSERLAALLSVWIKKIEEKKLRKPPLKSKRIVG
jgi:hypothetical protein